MKRREAMVKTAAAVGGLTVMGLAWGELPGPRPDWPRGVQRLRGHYAYVVWARDPDSDFEAVNLVEHGDDVLAELECCDRAVRRHREGREER